MNLRPYQLKAVEAVKNDWQSHQSVLLVAACGLGKTQIFCQIIDEVCRNGKRALVLVHRRELVEQARNRLHKYWPQWKHKTGVVMAEYNHVDAQILFGTVQTVINRDIGNIDYFIQDECHRATSNTSVDVIERLKQTNPDIKILGVTATPKRADGVGMVNVFEKTSAVYDILFAVKNKYLVPPRWLAVQTGISLGNVAKNYQNGDFNAKQLADVFETKNCFELVVKTHQEYATDRQAIAFTTTVQGAYDLAETFNDAGITAVAADAKTSKTDRKRILDDFRNGRVQVLCNVGLYTEGLDVPEVSCIHQVRPTQSDGLYIQMIGRGLRIFPNKEDCLILDYAPKESRQIVMLGDVLGQKRIRKDAYIEQDAGEGDIIGGFTFDGNFHFLEGSPAEIITRQLNYLDDTPWRWYRGNDGWMSLGLGKASDDIERTAIISPPDDDGNMTLYAVWKDKDQKYWESKLYAVGTFEELSETADEWAAKYAVDILSMKGKHWQKQYPTEGQIRWAKQLKVWNDGLTRGECSVRINHALAMKSIGV